MILIEVLKYKVSGAERGIEKLMLVVRRKKERENHGQENKPVLKM